MKDLVVYYSLEGNTAYVAEIISKRTGADLLRLEPSMTIISLSRESLQCSKEIIRLLGTIFSRNRHLKRRSGS